MNERKRLDELAEDELLRVEAIKGTEDRLLRGKPEEAPKATLGEILGQAIAEADEPSSSTSAWRSCEGSSGE